LIAMNDIVIAPSSSNSKLSSPSGRTQIPLVTSLFSDNHLGRRIAS